MRIGHKFSILGISAVILTSLCTIGIGVRQTDSVSSIAGVEIDNLVDQNFSNLVHGVYSLAQVQSDNITQQLNTGLMLAGKLLKDHGRLSTSTEATEWNAINQFTKTALSINLPVMLLGDKATRRVTSMQEDAGLVDEITRFTGAKATLFQRMNEDGDLLRISTSVETKEGMRAIGTYIPAKNPDGSANPVAASIMRGETYRGQAYVVNAWYQTVYEPLKDSTGRIIGALFLGIRQDSVPALRQAIMDIKLGKSGYVFVLSGKGETRGTYLISLNGARDGERIWDTKTESGVYPIRDMVEKTVALKPGETAEYRYEWKNPKDPAPRWKRATLAYFAPWDWVIGASTYEDEFQDGQQRMNDVKTSMIKQLILTGIIAGLIFGLVFLFFGRALSRKLGLITGVADLLARGDVNGASQKLSSFQDRIK